MTRLVTLLVAMLLGVSAHAAVSLTGTRLIFDGRFNQARLEVLNRSDQEVLIQAWLSDANNVDGAPQLAAAELPFVLTPHLSRLERHAKQTLRVLYRGEGMPQTVESLIHLYVLEVPGRVEGANALSIAIRQRINVFYRPPGLTDDPGETAQRLQWTWSDAGLRVSNPTQFHAALQDVRLDNVAVDDYLLLAPGASHPFLAAVPAQPRRLSFQALTDYGSPRNYCAQANGNGFNNTYHRQKDC